MNYVGIVRGDDQFSKEISFVRTVLMMRFDIKESIFEFSSWILVCYTKIIDMNEFQWNDALIFKIQIWMKILIRR